MTEIQKLQRLIQDFCDERDWNQFHNPKDLAIGISTEANELLDIFRFKSPEQMEQMISDEGQRKHIEEELGDVFFFLLRFAQMNQFDLKICVENKLKKNKLKYPAELVKGNNLKYTEYHEGVSEIHKEDYTENI